MDKEAEAAFAAFVDMIDADLPGNTAGAALTILEPNEAFTAEELTERERRASFVDLRNNIWPKSTTPSQKQLNDFMDWYGIDPTGPGKVEYVDPCST